MTFFLTFAYLRDHKIYSNTHIGCILFLELAV